MILKQPLAVDISHWKTVNDFAAISPRPVLIITKATEHVSYTDPTFVKYFTLMKTAGYKRGAFHFFRRFYNATEQARHFCDTIRPYVLDDDILVLDFEEGGETAAQLIAFLGYVRAQFPRNLIMNYSRQNLMNAIPMTAAQADVLRQYPVWVAGYPANPDQYSSVPYFYKPNGNWGEVWLWQYTSSGVVSGISGDVDCNWMRADLIAKIGEIDAGNEAVMTRYEAINIYDNMALRPDHNTANESTVRYPHGQKFHGDSLFVAQAQLRDSAGNVYQMVGDTWLQVLDVNGVARSGWVAVIHLGKMYCNLTDYGAPNEPPADGPAQPLTITSIEAVFTLTDASGAVWEAVVTDAPNVTFARKA
jgi:lysozyme